MLKIIAAVVAVLSIVGTSVVSAQQSKVPQDAVRPVALANPAPQWTAEDVAAFSEARIAALKAGLALKSDQEKTWTAFERALRAQIKEQTDRVKEASSKPPASDPIAYMRRRADALDVAAASLRKLADAAEPLYRSLDDSQKRRMVALVAVRR